MVKYSSDMTSLNSSLETSSQPPISSSSDASTSGSGSTQKKPFSWTSPSTWSTPSFSGIFKSESCEQKKDKTINAATKTIEKAKADYNTCASNRSAPKAAASSGSMFSIFGVGSTPAAATPKVGGRKKTQKKQKKQKKPKNTNKRRTK
jgi:hypothetical protein